MPFFRTGYVAQLLAGILCSWYSRRCIAMHVYGQHMSDDRAHRSLQGTTATGASFYKSDWYYSQKPYTRKGHLKNRVDPKMEKKVYTKVEKEEDCINRYGTGRLGEIACHGMMSKGKIGMMEGMMNVGPKTGKGMLSINISKNCGMGKGNIFCPPSGFDSTVPSIVPTPSSAPYYPSKGMMMGGMGKNKSSKCGKGKEIMSCAPIGFESSYPSDVPSLVSPPPSDGPESNVPTSDPFTLTPGASDGPSMIPIRTPTNLPTASMQFPTIAPTAPPSLPTGTSEGPSLTPTVAPTKSADLPIGAPIITPSAVTTQPSITMVPSLKTGSPGPTVRSVASPTTEPTLLKITKSPVPAPSNRTLELRATPFSIAYGISDSDNIPISDDHWMAAQNITTEFLQDFLNEQFDSSTTTTVDQYISNVLEANVTQVPPSLAFAFQVLFTDSTTFVPSTEEIDIVIESAFVAPFADVLISLLQQLDAANPFSTTMTVVYTIRLDLTSLKQGRSQNGNENSTNSPIALPPDDWNYETMIQLYKESVIKIPPFSLTYEFGWNETNSGIEVRDTDPTIGETKAAANITLAYLDWYLRLMLNAKQPDSYVYMTGFGMSTQQAENVIEFYVGLQVHNLTNLTAMETDVNMIVTTAFQPKYAVSLLQQMRASLPSTNPFSRSTTIAFAYSRDTADAGLPTLTRMTIIVASCTFVLFCILFMYYRRRKSFLIKKRQSIPKVIIQYNNESIHGDLIEMISEEGTEEEDLLRSSDALRQPLMDPSATTIYSKEVEEIIEFQCATESVASEHHLLWNNDTLPLKYTEPKIFEHVD